MIHKPTVFRFLTAAELQDSNPKVILDQVEHASEGWEKGKHMNGHFEELDYRLTPMGELSLRRRRDASTGTSVFEVKLNDDFLMSSLFTAGEIALARLALAELSGTDHDVVVGGLGLGYTARAVLENPKVRSVIVVEALAEVIEWHNRRLLPLSNELISDPRCQLAHGDFFRISAGPDQGFDADHPARRFHAILVDIDHSPGNVLDPSHAPFYTAAGLRRLASHLIPGGVFALWSNDPPDEAFVATLTSSFETVSPQIVTFASLQREREVSNTVYLARTTQHAL